MEQGQLWRQYIIAGVVNIAIISSGYSMGWTSPINDKLADVDQSPLPEVITVNQRAWIGSLITVGATFGPFSAGFLNPRIGRKWSLMASSVPLLLGWILVAAATNVGFLYGGRFAWGIGVGMLYTVLPMYCAEIATIDSRGALVSFLQTSINIGCQLVYVIGPFISYSAVAYVGLALVVVFMVLFFFLPESPFYLLLKNDKEAATKCLMKIRGRSRSGVQKELVSMEDDVKASMAKPAAIADLFRGSNFKAFYISCALIFFQQFSGITAVLYYMTTIFGAAGGSLDPPIATIIVGAVQMVSSLITPFFVDRVGRRILLLISTLGTTVALGLLGAYFLISESGSSLKDTLSFLPILSLVLFIVTYSWGLGPLPWTIVSELFSLEVKATASPIIAVFCAALSFIVTRYFEPVGLAVGMYTVFWIFGVCCALCFFFTLFVLPETKGKSFPEIQEMLAGNTCARGSQRQPPSKGAFISPSAAREDKAQKTQPGLHASRLLESQ